MGAALAIMNQGMVVVEEKEKNVVVAEGEKVVIEEEKGRKRELLDGHVLSPPDRYGGTYYEVVLSLLCHKCFPFFQRRPTRFNAP